MAFFASAIDTLKVLVMAIGCGLGAWGIVNLLEGYGADNPAAMLMCHKVTHKNLIDSSHTISKIYKKVNRFLKVHMVKYNYSKGTKRNFGETHRKRGDSDGRYNQRLIACWMNK